MKSVAHPAIRRLLFGALMSAVVGCSKEPPAPASRAGTSSSPTAAVQDAAGAPAGPNAENPDASWVDLATIPFRPERVGGRFVRAQAPPHSLNAITNESADVERLLKFFLGAPLLIERPDRVEGVPEAMPWGAVGMPDVSADGLTHTWRLRDDVTWDDGKPVTAEDYVVTFKLMRTPDVECRTRDTFAGVERVEAVDSRTVRVVWKERNFRNVIRFGLDFYVVPAHAVPTDARSFNEVLTHPTCGAYRVVRHAADRSELALRDEYRKAPFPLRPMYLERFVTEKTAPDAVYVKIVNGEAHLGQTSFERFLEAGASEEFRRVAWRAPVQVPFVSFLAWNVRDPADAKRVRPHPVLGDARVRRALAHLIDLEGINRSVFRGCAVPVSGPFFHLDDGYDAAIKPRPFDPAAAARLLDEAGFRVGADGVREKDGRRCALTLLSPLGAPAVFDVVASSFQEAARKAGVAVEIEKRMKFQDTAAAAAAGKFDATIALWQLDAIEPDVSDQWHSRFAATGGANWSGWADPETDRILDAVAASPESAHHARVALRRALHRRLFDEAPYVFLFSNPAPVLASKQFANWRVHDFGLRFWDLVSRDLWEKYPPP